MMNRDPKKAPPLPANRRQKRPTYTYAQVVRMMAREHYSKAANTGRVVLAGSSEGGYARRGKYKVQPAVLQTALAEKMAANPSLSLTRAREFVAKDLHVSVRTVRTHTHKPSAEVLPFPARKAKGE